MGRGADRRPGGAVRDRREPRGAAHAARLAVPHGRAAAALGPPAELEDPAPPRFAQGVGLAFTLVALVGFAAGATLLGQVAIGLALVAALLNAVFRLCLGCELYLLVKRAQGGCDPNRPPDNDNEQQREGNQ